MVDGSVVAEILEARKKKGKKGGSIPGPVIGYLMKKGVIAKGRKFKRKGKRAASKKGTAKMLKKVFKKRHSRERGKVGSTPNSELVTLTRTHAMSTAANRKKG
jgi:hypothetical protein